MGFANDNVGDEPMVVVMRTGQGYRSSCFRLNTAGSMIVSPLQEFCVIHCLKLCDTLLETWQACPSILLQSWRYPYISFPLMLSFVSGKEIATHAVRGEEEGYGVTDILFG